MFIYNVLPIVSVHLNSLGLGLGLGLGLLDLVLFNKKCHLWINFVHLM